MRYRVSSHLASSQYLILQAFNPCLLSIKVDHVWRLVLRHCKSTLIEVGASDNGAMVTLTRQYTVGLVGRGRRQVAELSCADLTGRRAIACQFVWSRFVRQEKWPDYREAELS